MFSGSAKLGFLFHFTILPGLLILACSPDKQAIPEADSPQNIVQLAAKPAPATKWDKILAEAKKEGKVVVYTSAGSEVGNKLGKAFKDKYGISADFIQGRGSELTPKLLTERKAGIYAVDAYVSGMGTSLFFQLKPAEALDPIEPLLILSEVTEPGVWFNGLGWIDKEKTALAFAAYVSNSVSVNSLQVAEGDIRSYRDILNPRWRKKIVMNDPLPTGTGQRFIGFLMETMGIDYLRGLANQEPVIVRDQRLQVEWLAHNKYAVATTPKPEILQEFIQAGAPIRNMVMEEGEAITAGGGVISIINKAPHPEAAIIFLNWLLSKDGQYVYSQAMGIQSRRLDVSTDHLNPVVIRRPGVKYLDHNRQEFLVREPEFRKIAQEIFDPYLK